MPQPSARRALAGAMMVALMTVAGCAGPAPSATPSATATSSPAAPSGPTPSGSVAPPTASPSPPPSAPASASPSSSPIQPAAITLTLLTEGLDPLVLLANAADGSGRVYAVEQSGRVLVGASPDALATEPFLDISDRVSFSGERGLLGLAFHPDYAANGRLFVDYSDHDGNNVIAEFQRLPDGSAADPDSERILLTIEQPFPNHNGGMLAFDPDGYLYISSGDGGAAGDPLGSGQALDTLLGKILRIDVDSDAGQAYAIPDDNPFADGAGGALPEIWDYGLRNPWRISFDRATGDLFIADVGQDRVEEVNAEPAGAGGRNYGWKVMEGRVCFQGRGCDEAGLTLPVATYNHQLGCSVTGGYVYRGAAVPALVGSYLYSDYCSGTLWALDAATAIATGSADPVVLLETGRRVTGFGEDEAGEVYLVTAEGEILRVDAAP